MSTHSTSSDARLRDRRMTGTAFVVTLAGAVVLRVGW
jgi:hypothetical protein